MTHHEQDRRKKLAELRALGVDPFAGVTKKTDSTCDLKQVTAGPHSEGPKCCLVGRIMLRRGMGKLGFLTVQDEYGTIQVALDKSRLTDLLWRVGQLLDLGDIIVVEGALGHTQKGELTIWADDLQVCAKALTPPPSKLEGLTDTELRYRNRHVDLLDKDVRAVMRTRSEMMASVRQYMNELGYLDVETPIMQPRAGGAAAKPFVTHHNALDCDLYLRIAPELYLKRLIIGGMGSVFEIGKNFRNEGLSPKHNPEFTVLEAYQPYGNYETMIGLTTGLVKEVAANTVGDGFPDTFRRVRLMDLLAEKGFNPSLAEAVQVYEEHVEPTLMEPTFVTHFPADAVPLAKQSADDPQFAEMFEFVMNGQEVGPGYTEQNDPDVQLAQFEKQREVDQDFIDALKCGMPPAGGVGIGLDRLFAILLGQKNIRDVILFPTLRPRNDEPCAS